MQNVADMSETGKNGGESGRNYFRLVGPIVMGDELFPISNIKCTYQKSQVISDF